MRKSDVENDITTTIEILKEETDMFDWGPMALTTVRRELRKLVEKVLEQKDQE